MTRRTKQGRQSRPEAAPVVIRRSKSRRSKKATGITKWVASPAVTAAMAAPQVMAGPALFS
jgi:hypothetical protein